MSIGLDVEKLEKHRAGLGLNQSQFAKLIGISRFHYSQLKLFKKGPSVKLLEKIYFATGLTPSESLKIQKGIV